MNPMKERVLPTIRRRIGGQTLVIALIMLGVLLLLGFVFLGLIDNGLHNQSLSQSSAQATDLAEAAIRDVHARLLSSELGADYRGTPSYFASATPTSSGDPDLFYLRPGTGLPLRSPTDTLIDLGGPDGLGPFVRYTYSNGRGLARIRYAPSDADLFVSSPVGPLRNPGAARDYLIIEAIGRTGQVLPNDPTTLNVAGGIQYTGYTSWQQYHTAFQLMEQANGQLATSRRLIALQAIGITEQALFFTNKDHVNRPAEIGPPDEMGASYTANYGGQLVNVLVASNPDFPNPTAADQNTYGGLGLSEQLGGPSSMPNTAGQSILNIPNGGGIRSNADLMVYGNLAVNLNQTMGESISVAGSIIPADSNSKIVFSTSFRDATGNWQTPAPFSANAAAITTGSTSFNTEGGYLRDGSGSTDSNGYPRSVGYEEPPSLGVVDAATGENRYLEATRDSGIELGGVNSGIYGYGRGVYVDNFGDRQNPIDEQGRQDVGSSDSLVNDWLNPNNGQSGTGWQGPYYVPPAAYVQLVRDGFVIQRDSTGTNIEQQYWKNPNNGSSIGPNGSSSSVIRYRIGADPTGTMRILNSVVNYPLDMSGPLQPTDFAQGFPFNGVLYFEGNVRVRGTIPTDVQLMLVSNASIYIEGSITKGDVETAWSASQDGGGTIGSVITHGPKAMLMLAAKDYVTVNTPNFFGPTPGQVLSVLNDVVNDQQYKPLDLSADQTLNFTHEMAMETQPSSVNPTINTANPATYLPYSIAYVDALNNSQSITPTLTLVHTMDNGPAGQTFMQLLINYSGSAANSAYEFPLTSWDYPLGPQTNSAAGFNGDNNGNIPDWGLGIEPWQRYPRFEADEFPLNATGTGALSADGLSIAPAPTTSGVPNLYPLYTREANNFMIQPAAFTGTPTNDYLLGRVMVTPDDVKIEATIFAEQGSFFVIPGQWVNPNPSDRHDLFPTLGSDTLEQTLARLQDFGSNPLFPFYGEPPDVRIVINGAISENMPPPIAQQAEYLRKWGWIPMHRGSDTNYIPLQHVPAGYQAGRDAYVPNLIINYDPALATATNAGYTAAGPSQNSVIRYDQFQRVLPPIPRLPVSPSLAYFGEVH